MQLADYLLCMQNKIRRLDFNPLMPNRFSRTYHLDKSISNLRLMGGKFQFHLIFKSTFCKQTVQNLIRRRVLWCLIWFFTVCRCPIRRTLGLNGLSYFCLELKGLILLYLALKIKKNNHKFVFTWTDISTG